MSNMAKKVASRPPGSPDRPHFLWDWPTTGPFRRDAQSRSWDAVAHEVHACRTQKCREERVSGRRGPKRPEAAHGVRSVPEAFRRPGEGWGSRHTGRPRRPQSGPSGGRNPRSTRPRAALRPGARPTGEPPNLQSDLGGVGIRPSKQTRKRARHESDAYTIGCSFGFLLLPCVHCNSRRDGTISPPLDAPESCST
jgi:hypothetical protein